MPILKNLLLTLPYVQVQLQIHMFEEIAQLNEIKLDGEQH